MRSPNPQRPQQPKRQDQQDSVGDDINNRQRAIPRVDVDALALSRSRSVPVPADGLASVEDLEGTKQAIRNDDEKNGADDDVEAAADGEAEVEGEDGGLGEEDGEVAEDVAGEGGGEHVHLHDVPNVFSGDFVSVFAEAVLLCFCVGSQQTWCRRGGGRFT